MAPSEDRSWQHMSRNSWRTDDSFGNFGEKIQFLEKLIPESLSLIFKENNLEADKKTDAKQNHTGCNNWEYSFQFRVYSSDRLVRVTD